MSLLSQWMGHGALQGAGNAGAANVYGTAQQSFVPPAPTFGENVPADELVFIGICTRWPDIEPVMYPAVKKRQHDINCCQRMLML